MKSLFDSDGRKLDGFADLTVVSGAAAAATCALIFHDHVVPETISGHEPCRRTVIA